MLYSVQNKKLKAQLERFTYDFGVRRVAAWLSYVLFVTVKAKKGLRVKNRKSFLSIRFWSVVLSSLDCARDLGTKTKTMWFQVWQFDFTGSDRCELLFNYQVCFVFHFFFFKNYLQLLSRKIRIKCLQNSGLLIFGSSLSTYAVELWQEKLSYLYFVQP